MKDGDNNNSNLSTKATIVVGIFAALIALSSQQSSLEKTIILESGISWWAIGLVVTFSLVLSMYIYSLGYIISLYPIIAKLPIFRRTEQIGDMIFTFSLLFPVLFPTLILFAVVLRNILSTLSENLVDFFDTLVDFYPIMGLLIVIFLQSLLTYRSNRYRMKLLNAQIEYYKEQLTNLESSNNNSYYLFELIKSIEANLQRLYSGLSYGSRSSLRTMINYAAQDGFVNEYERAQLLDLLDFRNQFAHGHHSDENNHSKKAIDEMINAAKKVLKKLESIPNASKNIVFKHMAER